MQPGGLPEKLGGGQSNKEGAWLGWMEAEAKLRATGRGANPFSASIRDAPTRLVIIWVEEARWHLQVRKTGADQISLSRWNGR